MTRSTRFVDLSHTIEDGMPGFRMRESDGTLIEYTARVHPFRTHEQMSRNYAEGCSFEITELTLQTSVGTYLDAPYHRYPTMKDIGAIDLEEVILEGAVVDVRGREPLQAVGPEVVPEEEAVRGRAVLFNFGRDAFWGTEEYYTYPFLHPDAVRLLIERGARLVGVDTLNIDDARDPERPAHSLLLAEEIYVLENLTNLTALLGKEFRLFAVPLKVKGAAAMPVRAFAEVG